MKSRWKVTLFWCILFLVPWFTVRLEKPRMELDNLGQLAVGLRKAIQADPENSEHHLMLALILQSFDIKRHTGGSLHEEILQAFETAARLGVSPEQNLLLHMRLGVHLTTMSRPVQALEAFDVVLLDKTANEHRADVHFYRAQTLTSMGNIDESEKEYSRAIGIDPSNSKAWLGLVVLRRDTETIRGRPTDVTAWTNMINGMEEQLNLIFAENRTDAAEDIASFCFGLFHAYDHLPLGDDDEEGDSSMNRNTPKESYISFFFSDDGSI